MSSTDGGLWVTIGPREIYEAVTSVSTKVDRDSAKLDLLASDVRNLSTGQQDHERRLRVMERARWPLPSLAVLIAFAGFMYTVLVHH